jgi:DEAD/DEAH box helicase domain-containing protein
LQVDIKEALLKQGFYNLFSHQVETRNKVKLGKDVVVTTPTSSGKSLCFHVPVFESIVKNPDSTTALYLFPLNALARV